MISRDEIVQHALALPADDRAFLLDLLEESLPHPRESTQDYAREWSAEINRRVDAYLRGETRATDAATAMQAMRDQLGQRLADQAP